MESLRLLRHFKTSRISWRSWCSFLFVACFAAQPQRIVPPGRYYIHVIVHHVNDPLDTTFVGYLGSKNVFDMDNSDVRNIQVPLDAVRVLEESDDIDDVLMEPTEVQVQAGAFEVAYPSDNSVEFTLQYRLPGRLEGKYVEMDCLLRILRFSDEPTTRFRMRRHNMEVVNAATICGDAVEGRMFLNAWSLYDHTLAIAVLGESTQSYSESEQVTTSIAFESEEASYVQLEEGPEVELTAHIMYFASPERPPNGYHATIGFDDASMSKSLNVIITNNTTQGSVEEEKEAFAVDHAPEHVLPPELNALSKRKGTVAMFRKITRYGSFLSPNRNAPLRSDGFNLQYVNKESKWHGYYVCVLEDGTLSLDVLQAALFTMEAKSGTQEKQLRLLDAPENKAYLHPVYTKTKSFWRVGPASLHSNFFQDSFPFTTTAIALKQVGEKLFTQSDPDIPSTRPLSPNDRDWLLNLAMMKKKYGLNNDNLPGEDFPPKSSSSKRRPPSMALSSSSSSSWNIKRKIQQTNRDLLVRKLRYPTKDSMWSKTSLPKQSRLINQGIAAAVTTVARFRPTR